MWTRSIGQPGGVVGGNNLEILGNTWFEGTAYSQRYTNPIIVAGMLVYREPFESTGTAGDTVCVNLFTGEEIWRNPSLPSFSFAYVQDMENPDFHGVRPAYLCTSNFGQVYDAATGKNVFNATNVPSGTTFVGSNGEQMRYIIYNNGTSQNPDYYLCLWNSSRWWNPASMQQRNLRSTTTSTTTNVSSTTYVNGVLTTVLTPTTTTTTIVNASRAYMYEFLNPLTQNVSIPWRNGQAGSPAIRAVLPGDLLLCMNGSYPSSLAPTGNNPYNYFAVNLNASKGPVGSILWWNTVQPAVDPVYGNLTVVAFGGASQSGFCESYRQNERFAFFNIRTGAFIKLSERQPALDYYGSTGSGARHNVIAFDRCYSSAYGGVLYCYDMATGEVLWTYGNGGPGNTTNSGFEVPGPYPTFVKAIGGKDLSDGVIYTVVTEHTFETPIAKGALTRAINASDGSEIYTLAAATGEFGAGSFAIADGYTNFFNSYVSQIYTLGRGPSQTTVTVGPKSSTLGGNVVIEGTVTDVSVGLKTTEIEGRFPTGVPACADISMKDWMGYVYQQQPLPSNFKGVDVGLSVVDSNGNYRDIGTATTDSKGNYYLVWTPDIPGTYNVIAAFGGTKGYWPSYQETVFSVVETAATPTAQPITNQPSLADQYILPLGIAIIVSIFIVGAIIALLVRKRP
jgi:outer membrane protein assembly factor BamB